MGVMNPGTHRTDLRIMTRAIVGGAAPPSTVYGPAKYGRRV